MKNIADHRITITSFILFMLAVFSLLAVMFGKISFWGWSALSRFPLWSWGIAATVMLIFAISPVSAMVGKFLHRLTYLHPVVPSATYFVLVAVILGATAILPSQNHAMGDGFNILGNIGSGRVTSPIEPLEYFLHLQFRNVLSGENAALNSFRISAFVAAIVLSFGLFLILSRKEDSILALAILSTSAVSQFFFGYVEHYTYSFVLALLFFLLCASSRDRGSSMIPVILLLGLAIAFHFRSLAYLPTIIYLLYNRQKSLPLLIIMIISALLIVLAAFAIADLSDIRPSQFFVPLYATDENPYYLFSMAHLIDMLNILGLNFPLLCLTFFVPSLACSALAPYWLVSIVPALTLTFIIDPKIGAVRDWDLLTLAAPPILAFLIIDLCSSKSPHWAKMRLLIPLCIFGLMHSGSWIHFNSDKAGSYPVIKQIVQNDIHYDGSYFKGYRNKSWAQIASVEYLDNRELVRAQEIRYRSDPMDTTAMLQFVNNSIVIGDTARALLVIDSNWVRLINCSRAVKLFGAIMVSSGRLSDAERIYSHYLQEGGDDYKVMHDFGLVNLQLGSKDKAIYYYDLSYKKRNEPNIKQELPFYLDIIGAGHYEMAQTGLRRILAKIPAERANDVSILIDALASKSHSRADSLAVNIRKSLLPGR
jgi:hypothetical protein